MQINPNEIPDKIKLFLNQLYEYKKGVRNMVLCTMEEEYVEYAAKRLESQNISYLKQVVTDKKVNLYFGRSECLDAIRMIVTRSLHQLTPEEDFILGALLGYDICRQCMRYCYKKKQEVA